MLFRDRHDAGRKLATKLLKYANRDDVVVLGLPRGGVPVAYQVGQQLNAPIDVFIVRKLGVPGHEELAMGAIASGNISVFNNQLIEQMHVSHPQVASVAAREKQELIRRENLYRRDRTALEITGKQVIVVDDGLATGASMRAAIMAISRMDPARVVVAVPVAAPETCRMFQRYVDEVICYATPESFTSVGSWYRDFHQITDQEVQKLLELAAKNRQAA